MKIFLLLLLVSVNCFSAPMEELNTKLQLAKSKKPSLQYDEITQLWREIALSRPSDETPEIFERELKTKTRLQSVASQLRSEVIQKDQFQIEFKDYIKDSIFEIQIIPNKWISIFQLKYIQIKSHIDSNEYALILPEVFSILLFALLPFLLLKFYNGINNSLNNMTRGLARTFQQSLWKRKLAVHLQWLSPYISYSATLAFLKISSDLIQRTLVAEISLLIPYLIYYIYYLIFKLTVVNILRYSSERAMILNYRDTRKKIIKHVKRLGRFLFFSMISLYSISSVSSKSLVYRELSVLFLGIGIVLVYLLVFDWQNEINKILERYLSDKRKPILAKFQKSFFYKVTLPIFFLYTIWLPFSNMLRQRASEWSITRAIAAKLFKKKLESVEEGSEQTQKRELPTSYLKYFEPSLEEDDTYFDSNLPHLELMTQEIQEWLDEKTDEHTMAIYGDKGCGKTLSLKHVTSKFEDCDVITASVPSKLSQRDDVFEFISHLFKENESSGIESILNLDKELKPTIIVLDDAQNFFLSHFGGLDGIKALFEILNLRTNNIFWIASFNTYSWYYLNQAFSKNKYFRVAIRIKGFDEEGLQNLIMYRHKKSEFKLSYADIIQAFRSNDESGSTTYLETLFFRMLWEQSKGNPSLAMKLWISSLTPIKKNRLKVGLPMAYSSKILSEFSDECHFTYASIIRHENLTTKELTKVTNLDEGIVRHALRLGLENEFLTRGDDNRYRFDLGTQYQLINFLRAKNFIYEG